MRTSLILLSLALLGGCHVCATAEDYAWTVKAPATVVEAPHSRLQFVVETTTADGRAVGDVPFVWVVDWVGMAGADHQGRSFREQHLLVKGASGTAVLRILACARTGGMVEVARHPFQVLTGGDSPLP